jgi:capsular exopolysaccharide synthesis family protein
MNEARLTRDLTIANQLYTSLEQRYSEAKLADASAIPDVRILDPAVVPDKPLQDRVPVVILGGVIGGFALAIGLALMLDHFDRRLRYPDQVTRDMGLAILGAVPRVKSNGSSLRGEDAAQVVESLRSIRLNLVHAYGSAGPLVTTITSPGSGDGKSFLASNLALAFADAGHRTLLIDGDIRRGTLHRVLNAQRKPGLIDYLSGQATKEQVVQTTRMTSVDFIGCGTRKAGGPELLASPAMSQLLIGMRSLYSVIIMDSAPLGAGVDPLLLGSLTGSLLLVLRTGVTDRELASAKLGDLNRLPIRVLGAVLNDVKPQGMYKYYSYLPGYHAEDEGEVANPGARALPATKT